MEKIQLIHPEGKKGVPMDKDKYDALSTSFIQCLKQKGKAPFQELMEDVEKDLAGRGQTIKGKLEWNLFWVTLDLEARKLILRDKKASPMQYSLPE